MSSKPPLPGRALHARDKESQRHPGKPDQPCPRWPTQEVQAEKAKKANVLADKEHLCSETVQATAKLENCMEVLLKEKLATAHHPPPSMQKRVLCATAKKSLVVVPEGMTYFQKRFCVKPACPDNLKGARSPEEEQSSNEYEPDADEGPDDNGSVNNKDDECVLDESSDKDLNQKKRKGKKKADNRQLQMQVQSAQGKSTSDGKNSKHKANKNQDKL
jgi:hypothetical protein